MNRNVFFTLFFLVFTLSAQATFLPENEIRYDRLSRGPSQITEAQFKDLIHQVQSTYVDTVTSLGGRLLISGDWKSEKLNAYSMQAFGGWLIQMYGGLARRPELSPDGFTLVMCHELGHHLGGFSFANSTAPFAKAWAANEGQADYYATQVCARKLWSQQASLNASFRNQVSTFVTSKCDAVWSEREQRDLCYRIAAAVDSLSKTMAGITSKPIPDFTTPDPKAVAETNVKHPDLQCRMDTNFQGALCTARFNDKIIPGKTTKGGPKGIEAEKEAAQYSCTTMSGFKEGLRPSCWFKARL